MKGIFEDLVEIVNVLVNMHKNGICGLDGDFKRKGLAQY